jgi:predicted transport protein
MRKAMLAALRKAPEGLGLVDLAIQVAPRLPLWWSREGWDEMWHATSVKLHLEYLGEIERVPQAKPHRVRIKALVPAATTAEAKRVAAPTATQKKPKSPMEMLETMARNLPARTGRSLAEWIEIVRASGLTDCREAENWLKREHRLTGMYAYMIAGAALNVSMTDYGDESGLLDAMYAGPRAALRPIYDKLCAIALKLGPDVEKVVCKTYVSYRAKTQFAVVQPTTQTLVDLALALPPDTVSVGRLEACKPTGGGERNRHRIRLSSVKDIDSEVKAWFKAAYAHDKSRRGK